VTPRKPPSDDQLREAFSEVGDALQRAVVLSTDRVQSVFEDAVLRGRMTRRDAEELASSLAALGRDQALELRGELDAIARALPSKVVEAVDPRAKRRKKKERDEAEEEKRREAARFVTAEAFVDKKKAAAKPVPAAAAPSTTPGALPADPSKATAKELIALVASLSPEALKTLRTQEAAGKARATVLKAIDQRTAA
jgi:hypothetical protein